MDQDAIVDSITSTFAGVEVVVASGDRFFFYDPDGTSDPTRRQPFATLVTGDRYDRVSNLSRPSVFRLNIGVSRDTYRAMIGAPPSRPGPDGVVDTGHDFAALDRLLPHPVYAPQFWVCVLNPSAETFQTVRRLLAEAYDRSVKRHAKTRPGKES